MNSPASPCVSAARSRNIVSMPLPPIASTILNVIGNTPMVRINRITRGVIDAEVLVKIETFNLSLIHI